jgi:hypothetical protein
MGDAMSLLRNPDFESGQLQPWKLVVGADTAEHHVINEVDKARTGSHCLKFKASTERSSVAQDIAVTMPSVTALAYVRADTIDVSGSLTIWDLAANRKISAPFKVGQTWAQVVAMLGRQNSGTNGPVRIELYLDTTGAFMYIDSVAAF